MRLGIAGYAESGKDVIAEVLERKFEFQRIGMSDALNDYLCILNPIVTVTHEVHAPAEHIRYVTLIERYGYVQAKKRFPEVRRLLQVFGTEVGRAIDPYMWVNERDKRMTGANCVTTGIRFPEEIEGCDFLLWVDRPGYGPVNDHVSDDTGWIRDWADATISNSGTLRDLEMWAEYDLPRWLNEVV